MTAATTPKTISIRPGASVDKIATALKALHDGEVDAVTFPYPIEFRRSADDCPAKAGERCEEIGKATLAHPPMGESMKLWLAEQKRSLKAAAPSSGMDATAGGK
ncbi:hypothetical protein [Pleomorphomonas sp. JP5]|uniref:hypothetical protein n=1 Tax=Pleomorphomonas sp. JP5 TaxID=2942998 RepID=UPI0020437EC1|nr:hypothetical protein [Pleomorphomonas sp. JP5]MCM5556309.1 hypothetical protein [Pleomorphomonas sp. JP5]